MWSFNAADYLSIIAFAILIWQIRRAANLAEAARDAAMSASLQSATYNLLVLAPQFDRCEAQLESSVRVGDAQLALEGLKQWRRLTAELKGLLKDHHENRQEITKQLDRSLVLLVAAKKLVIQDDGTTLIQNTERLRDAMSKSTDLIATLTAQVRTRLGPVPADQQPAPRRSLWKRRTAGTKPAEGE